MTKSMGYFALALLCSIKVDVIEITGLWTAILAVVFALGAVGFYVASFFTSK